MAQDDSKTIQAKSEVNIHNLQNIIKYLGNSCKDTVKSICAFLLIYEMSLLWKIKEKTGGKITFLKIIQLNEIMYCYLHLFLDSSSVNKHSYHQWMI